jgi:hypothetical protein
LRNSLLALPCGAPESLERKSPRFTDIVPFSIQIADAASLQGRFCIEVCVVKRVAYFSDRHAFLPEKTGYLPVTSLRDFSANKRSIQLLKHASR